MAGDLVLLTGATGFLGFRVLVDLLKSGYSVRVAVRSQSKITKVLATPSILALKPSAAQLTFTIVPNMAVEGAYDEAVKGAKYVIHVASPLPDLGGSNPPSPDQYEDVYIKPAQAGDIGMLTSAQKSSTVKRIVLTSSTVATVPFEYYFGQGADYSTSFEANNRIPTPPGPYQVEFQAYAASKVNALNEVEAWIKKEKPHYDLITIMPPWILGYNELAASTRELTHGGTNSVLMQLLLGKKTDTPNNGNAVLVDDCARVHVLALDPAVKGGQSFNTSSDVIWEDAIAVVRKYFPDAVADGRLSTEGKQPTVKLLIPTKKTEEAFGIKFAPFEDIVKAVVGQYLELLAREKA